MVTEAEINLGMDGLLQDFTNCRKDCDGSVVTRVTSVARLIQKDDFSRHPSIGECR